MPTVVIVITPFLMRAIQLVELLVKNLRDAIDTVPSAITEDFYCKLSDCCAWAHNNLLELAKLVQILSTA